MTIAPATLNQMLASSRIEAVKTAIVGRLKVLLPGIAVVSHPGKLDANDILARATVPAPGITLGWSRIRARRNLSGTYALPVDFVAYIVAEDWADTAASRRIDRESVGHAIGAQLLKILGDADTASWGLTAIEPPAPDPEPEFRPVVTIKTAEFATWIAVVSWQQLLAEEGTSLFGGPTPVAHQVPEGMEFDVEGDDQNGLPTEILAMLAEADE